MRKFSALLLLVAASAFAQTKINPNTQVGWPSSCTSGLVYSPASNTCVAGAGLPDASAAYQTPLSTGAGTTYTPQQIIPFDATYTFWSNGPLAIAVQAGGSGYSGSGTCTLTGGTLVSGSADTCTATLSSGALTFALVGSGVYSSPPVLNFSGFTGGSGAYTTLTITSTTYARNESTGAVQFSGTDAAVVINDVLAQMVNTGGTLYFKNGIYNLNSSTAETVSPYTTLSYAVGIPSTNTGNYPAFNFVGESAGISSQTHPATQGVVFVVGTAAETDAGSNILAAFWMRPNTIYDPDYPAGNLYWNDHVSFRDLAINFQANTRGSEVAIDALEASYLEADHVGIGLQTAATGLGATGLVGIISPATPSDGALIKETEIDPGFDQDYQINTEHAVLINTETYRATIGYAYGWQENRNDSVIYHSSQFIHAMVYDCVNGIVAGPYLQSSAQLDIIGLDDEYITTGPWAMVAPVFTTTNASSASTRDLGGLFSWSNIQTAVGLGSLTTPFGQLPNGVFTGTHYSVEYNGDFSNGPNAPGVTGLGTTTSAGVSGIGPIDNQGEKDTTPSLAFAEGWSIPGQSVTDNYIFSLYDGSEWQAALSINPTTLAVTVPNLGTSTSPVCPNGVGGALTTSGCSGSSGSSSTPYMLAAYKVASWPMNEGSGSTFTSPFASNYATASNVTWTSGAATFNGTSSTATAASATPTSFLNTQPFSLSWWQNSANVTATSFPLSATEATTDTGWEILEGTDQIGFYFISNYATPNYLAVNTSAVLTANTLQHICITYSGSQTPAGVGIYVDGIAQTTNTVENTLSGSTASTQPLVIGAQAAGANYFDGTIADVSVYDVNIGATGCAALYAAGTQ